jgi:hypothetical protein
LALIDPAGSSDYEIFKHFEAHRWPAIVVLPAARFLAESSDSDRNAYPEDKPQHHATIATRFAIRQFSANFSEHDYFCNVIGRPLLREKDVGRQKSPVTNACWNDAEA